MKRTVTPATPRKNCMPYLIFFFFFFLCTLSSNENKTEAQKILLLEYKEKLYLVAPDSRVIKSLPFQGSLSTPDNANASTYILHRDTGQYIFMVDNQGNILHEFAKNEIPCRISSKDDSFVIINANDHYCFLYDKESGFGGKVSFNFISGTKIKDTFICSPNTKDNKLNLLFYDDIESKENMISLELNDLHKVSSLTTCGIEGDYFFGYFGDDNKAVFYDLRDRKSIKPLTLSQGDYIAFDAGLQLYRVHNFDDDFALAKVDPFDEEIKHTFDNVVDSFYMRELIYQMGDRFFICESGELKPILGSKGENCLFKTEYYEMYFNFDTKEVRIYFCKSEKEVITVLNRRYASLHDVLKIPFTKKHILVKKDDKQYDLYNEMGEALFSDVYLEQSGRHRSDFGGSIYTINDQNRLFVLTKTSQDIQYSLFFDKDDVPVNTPIITKVEPTNFSGVIFVFVFIILLFLGLWMLKKNLQKTEDED